MHAILVLSAVATLLLHVWLIWPAASSFLSKLPLSAAVFLWILGYVHKFIRSQKCRATIRAIRDQIFHGHHRRVSYTGASLITVQLPRAVLVHPGAYFYLHFPRVGLRQFRGEPMMAYGWKAANAADGWNRDCQLVKELTFLVEDQAHLTSVLSADDSEVTVEGPYGRELSLHQFKTVFLVAEGSGVAGIMPLATALAERRGFDQERKARSTSGEAGLQKTHAHRDNTMRLNIIWVLREASELNWAAESLRGLSRTDPGRVSTYTDKC